MTKGTSKRSSCYSFDVAIPAQRLPAATSFITTLPAGTIAPVPSVTPGPIKAVAATQTLSSIVIGRVINLKSSRPMIVGAGAEISPLTDADIRTNRHQRQAQDAHVLSDPDMVADRQPPFSTPACQPLKARHVSSKPVMSACQHVKACQLLHATQIQSCQHVSMSACQHVSFSIDVNPRP